MPTGKYYRTQAQLFAHLAVITSDPHIAERYNLMALEQLAKAEEVEPSASNKTERRPRHRQQRHDRDKAAWTRSGGAERRNTGDRRLPVLRLPSVCPSLRIAI